MTTAEPSVPVTFVPANLRGRLPPSLSRSGPVRGPVALVAVLVLMAGAAGCLNETYRIPDQELARLTNTPPEARGLAIRTVQRTAASTELTSTPYLPPGAPPPPNYPPPEGYTPGYYYGPTSHVHVGVVVWAPLPAPHYVARPTPVQSAPVVRGAPGGGGPARGTPGGFSPSQGKVDKGGVAALAIAGAAFTVGMIATEGARFDGWTRVHPAQPVHLVYPGGQQRAVPLYLLSAADVAGVEEAAISENDGRVDRLLRAPLDRKGLVWRFDAGLAGGGTIDRQPALGWGALMGLGFFPHQTFGLLVTGTVAAGDHGGTSYTNGRLALEANWLPLSLGRLHLGAFGMVGRQWAQSSSAAFDKISHESWVMGGGGLLELELTTRLALVLRAGLLKDMPDAGPSAPTAMLATVGFSIY